jgi:hypothetical protein
MSENVPGGFADKIQIVVKRLAPSLTKNPSASRISPIVGENSIGMRWPDVHSNSLSGKLRICPTETFTASGAVNSNSFGSFVGWLHLEHFRLGSAHCAGAPRQSYHGEHY